MQNLHTFNEFINEDWFNFFNSPESKKIMSEMKAGQIVIVPSQMNNIIHVGQLIEPLQDKIVLIGNFKLSDDNDWVFKLARYLRNSPIITKDYRSLNEKEKKIISWYFSQPSKIETIKQLTKLKPII